ncbi:acetyltransferase [Pontibacter sp. G13]|uniref:acetyltransferase n=1 Tax=Pontibacter sp. G13 TaxID=3074898 RepID=UPI00288B44DE|nr:acetyltransferase [Pontibacter sp. G13]WNJ20714.1 acetyltransferase [Pontibacter sp. G13]
MEPSKLFIIGAGGFGKEVLGLVRDLQQSQSSEEVMGFIDEELVGKLIQGVSVLGNDEMAIRELPRDWRFVVAVGNSQLRSRIFRRYLQAGFQPVSLIHPSSIIGEQVALGIGTIVCAGSILTTDIRVGKGGIFNLHTSVGHDCQLGEFVTMSPGARLSGGVKVGNECEFGTNAVAIPEIAIGHRVRLGAGAVAISDLPDNQTYVGVPAKPVALS